MTTENKINASFPSGGTLGFSGSQQEAWNLLKATDSDYLSRTPTTTTQKIQGRVKKGIHNLFLENDKSIFQLSDYRRAGYTSFSGADSTVSILFKQGTPVIIGEAQTLTYSWYSPMEPVYVLGSRKPNGFIRGPRTIAGSIIFTVFDRHVLLSAFHKAYANFNDATCLDIEYLPDELPPFDLQVTFLNEYGQSSGLTIHDVRITSEGQVMSIEDMITENTMQYLASDITLMQPDFVLEPQ